MSASKSKGQSRGGEARGNRWDLAGGIWAEVRAARALSTAGSTRKPKGKSCLGARGQCRTAPGPVGNAAGARGRALLFAAVMSAARARCPLAGVHGGVVCCRGQALCKEARHGSDARQVGSRAGDCRRSERGARVPSRSPTERPALSAAEPCQDRPRTLQQRRRRRNKRRGEVAGSSGPARAAVAGSQSTAATSTRARQRPESRGRACALGGVTTGIVGYLTRRATDRSGKPLQWPSN